jgi:thiamine pyrophosphokinase
VFHPIAEQESTDFEKALRHVRAPFVLALGCLGGRVDHELAVFSALVQNDRQPCVLIGAQDVVFHAAAEVVLPLKAGVRVSLFPMARVSGQSQGLRWPLDGLQFAPDGRVGTSNESTGGVSLRFDGAGMLVILPRACLAMVIKALDGAG